MNSSDQNERRQHKRFPFNGGVKISGKIRVEPSDISEGGLYIITERSFMLGSEFDISLSFRDKELQVKVRVQNKQEGIGMGLMFISDNDEVKKNIRDFIEDISTDILKRSVKEQIILLIDDDIIMRKVCRCKLSSEGFSVVESAGGLEATEILDNQPVNLIVLNLELNKMDGFKMLGILKKSMKYKRTPLVAFSKTDSEDIAEKAKGAGANAYRTISAITSADLVKIIKEILPL
ncbi:response regulator [bacterium]|nr:MAG: response regulator [bacterium]